MEDLARETGIKAAPVFVATENSPSGRKNSYFYNLFIMSLTKRKIKMTKEKKFEVFFTWSCCVKFEGTDFDVIA